MTTPTQPEKAIREALPVVAWLTSWPKDRIRPAGCIVNRQEPEQKFDCNAYDALVKQSDAEAQLAEMRAEVERLRKNDARYRWLREQDWFSSDICVLREPKRVLTRGIGLGADCPSHHRLDAAIDACLAAIENGGANV